MTGDTSRTHRQHPVVRLAAFLVAVAATASLGWVAGQAWGPESATSHRAQDDMTHASQER